MIGDVFDVFSIRGVGMSLNLDEKQLMVLVANVIVNDPVFSGRMMALAKKEKKQKNILSNLNGVLKIVSEQCKLNNDKKTYVDKLRAEVGKIKNKDVSVIMMRAIVECKKMEW